jgi:CheY-like chemotaxis protein
MGPHDEIEILIVEDNSTDAELVMRALRKGNITNSATWLRDGAQALDFLLCEGEYAGREKSAQPRLVLLDLKLPKIDGIEVLERIKADERTRSIPVVMMTSSAEDRDLQAAYKLGVNSYVVKPLDFQEFSRVVAQAGSYWTIVNKLPSIS